MTRFLVQRGLESLAVLLVLSVAIYALMGLMPGDPIDIMVASDPEMTPADAARLKALQGLDQPLFGRYLAWASGVLQGEFGYSRLYAMPAEQAILPRLGSTVVLIGISTCLALAIAIPLGVIAAMRPNTIVDHGINLVCFAGISIPPFWLGILLILIFAVSLGWLPAGGTGRPDEGVLERAAHLVLPVVTLTLLSVGGFTRFMRAAMREALRQDYIRTARAKGVSATRAAWGHGLRNALLPLITVLGLSFGGLFSGALITETVFAYPGMGKLIYDAILSSDYAVAMLALMLATMVTLAGNFLADLAYVAVDPRVSLGGDADGRGGAS